MYIEDRNNPRINNIDEVFKSLGFFNSGEEMSFIFKKTEKIVKGLFMATNHIKDSDSIKWLIRERAVDMLYSVLQLNNFKNIKIDTLADEYISISFEIVTLLRLCSGSFLISTNNAEILINEVYKVIENIKNFISIKSSYGGVLMLDNDFFKLDGTNNGQVTKSNGGSVSKVNARSMIIGSIKGQDNIAQEGGISTNKKSNRQEQIIGLLKEKSGLTIKDFSSLIKDCSEKTIQRELIDLIRSGLVVKEGERRWSKYSLKNWLFGSKYDKVDTWILSYPH